MSELRKDPVTGRWVIIGSSWTGNLSFSAATRPPEAGTCPFCPGNEGKTPPEVLAYREPGTPANGPGWSVRVFPNRSPVLQVEGKLNPRGIGVFDMMSGVGANEVFVETPEHGKSLHQMSETQIEKVFWAYRDRILDLERDRRLRCILVFKNYGWEAGSLLAHPHSQLIALPIVPKVVIEELKGARRHFQIKERCIFCDMIRQELERESRLVAQNEHFLGFTPYASRFPFEAWLLPKRHEANFTCTSKEEMADFARLLKVVLATHSRSLGDPPYNYLLHTKPSWVANGEEGKAVGDFYHWHLEIVPRLMRLVGFESGSGLYLNPTPPEEAAARLREGLV